MFLVVAELPEWMAINPNAVWMRGYMHQSGYNLMVAPAACWVLIVVNGGASHCGHVGSESYQIYLSDVQLVHTLISTPCATSPWLAVDALWIYRQCFHSLWLCNG